MRIETRPNVNPREFTKIFFVYEHENLVDRLFNFEYRPVRLYRQLLPTVFTTVNIPVDTKTRWNYYAGCSQCPCTPGFIITAPTQYRKILVTISEKDKVPATDPELSGSISCRERRFYHDSTTYHYP